MAPGITCDMFLFRNDILGPLTNILPVWVLKIWTWGIWNSAFQFNFFGNDLYYANSYQVISLLTPFKLFFWCLPQKIKYENISQCMHKHFLCEYLGSHWYLRLIYSLVNLTENKVELWNSFHMKLVSLHNLLKTLPKFLLNWTSFPHFP